MNAFQIIVRSALRRVGAVGLVARLLGGNPDQAEYEERFGSALLEAVQAGDTVWDVGANLGHYTVQFAEAVGDDGCVHAFEPTPTCFVQLQGRLATDQHANIRLHNAALGDASGTAKMQLDHDPLGATHRVAGGDEPTGDGETIEVPIFAGDDLRKSASLPVPQVIKVDVEGFEQEVLSGLTETLSNDQCRAVFCEVHFGVLESRGRRFAPLAIERFLADCGFPRVDWIDSSHLHARRDAA